jgi:hypothetical protein
LTAPVCFCRSNIENLRDGALGFVFNSIKCLFKSPTRSVLFEQHTLQEKNDGGNEIHRKGAKYAKVFRQNQTFFYLFSFGALSVLSGESL